MIPFRPLFGQAQAYIVLFVSSALAALQNVTVDDAILTGAVIPRYSPSQSDWNEGNNCTECYVKPDPSLAYNGTWHDATYYPDNGDSDTQAIEFTFTGSALYIFFIIANNVTGATTFTDVQFVLDKSNGGAVSTYTHNPGATTDYQYNVPVYANDSLGYGQHNMIVRPVDSGNSVLILFDYLIYTTDISTSVSPTSTLPLISTTPSGTQGTSPRQHVGAIVGGTVGGIAALVFVTASLLCYRRYKRRNGGQPLAKEGAVVQPLSYVVEATPTSPVGATLSTYSNRYSFAEPAFTTGPSIVTLRPSTPPASTISPSIVTPQSSIPPATTTTTSSSSVARSTTNPALHQQVKLLRDEVARLRELHDAPPAYAIDENRWTD